MRDTNQTIIKFDYDKSFKKTDFILSKSNKHIYNFLDSWPKWEKNFINIIGQRSSGKTHLINIFIEKYKGKRIDAQSLNEVDLKKIEIHENIILEDLTSNINENLLYSLLNNIELNNKYIIITSLNPIVHIDFKLTDLKSRLKSFLLFNIEHPDDELIFGIILKNLSDRQISLDKKLIDYIVKRIERSYSKIHNFIYKIDQLSLKKKKSIDFKIIKEVLGE